MERKSFLKLLSLLPISASAMKLNELHQLTDSLKPTTEMPVLFVGHGSPMNAIEQNEFVRGWQRTANAIEKPKAILCISAHWETRGTYITAMAKPQTIHDFGGFPQALFDVQYPAPGSPQLAKETQNIITQTHVGLDEKWGLDHGCWSIIKPMYPNADIPVLQLSLDYTQPPEYHYQLAKELASLRKKGVLIIGSGNIVHNLGMVAWDKMNTPDYAYDWAIEANEKIKEYILTNNHNPLINYKKQGSAFNLAIPSPDHFLPLLYALALKKENEKITLFNDKALMGSLTMTSVKIEAI
jgi:4,5-DOPA dioxygenase extradiol